MCYLWLLATQIFCSSCWCQVLYGLVIFILLTCPSDILLKYSEEAFPASPLKCPCFAHRYDDVIATCERAIEVISLYIYIRVCELFSRGTSNLWELGSAWSWFFAMYCCAYSTIIVALPDDNSPPLRSASQFTPITPWWQQHTLDLGPHTWRCVFSRWTPEFIRVHFSARASTVALTSSLCILLLFHVRMLSEKRLRPGHRAIRERAGLILRQNNPHVKSIDFQTSSQKNDSCRLTCS